VGFCPSRGGPCPESFGRYRLPGITAQQVGLPGGQDKTSAAMINLPVVRAGERWILKLDAVEYPTWSRTRRSSSAPPGTAD
jgi:hypothetical protein